MVSSKEMIKVIEILEEYVKDLAAPIVDLVEAQTKDPQKVLIATILSARTKDETTSLVVKKLFKKINSIKDLNNYAVKEIEKLIYPIGFYKNKAKYLKKLPVVLEKEFNNVLPETVDELVKLPGVGRKTANLVVSVGFKKPAMCIDVHCHRIPQRLGWFKSENPYKTEMIMRKSLPKDYWIRFNSIFVAFGQNICRPISPYCSKCPVKKYCKQIGVNKHR
jgi:endonuclease III